MSVDEIKPLILALSSEERAEVSAFLFFSRHRSDPEYQSLIESRLSDRDPSHWLTLEEFERRLEEADKNRVD